MGTVTTYGDITARSVRWLVFRKVKAILTRLSGVHDITDATPLGPTGLDLDSLDRIQVAVELEEAFGIEIPDDDVDDPRMGTAGGIVAYIEGRLGR